MVCLPICIFDRGAGISLRLALPMTMQAVSRKLLGSPPLRQAEAGHLRHPSLVLLVVKKGKCCEEPKRETKEDLGGGGGLVNLSPTLGVKTGPQLHHWKQGKIAHQDKS